MTKFIATQDHVGRFGRFDEGDEFDTSDEHAPVDLIEAAAEAGLLRKVGATKQSIKKTAAKVKAETAAKPDEAETR